MKIKMPNGGYPEIEIDQSEKDVIILWQRGKEDTNCLIIQRDQIGALKKIIDLPLNSEKVIAKKEIISAITSVTSVSETELKSKCRKRPFADARKMYASIAFDRAGLIDMEIAADLNISRSTSCSSRKEHNKLLLEKNYRLKFIKIEEIIISKMKTGVIPPGKDQ